MVAGPAALAVAVAAAAWELSLDHVTLSKLLSMIDIPWLVMGGSG